LITCPDKKVTRLRGKAIDQVIKSCDQKGFPYVILYRKACKYENLAWCLTVLNHLRHWYHTGHGNAELEIKGKIVERTSIKLSDGSIFSYNRSNFDPNNVPEWYEDIGKYEKYKTMLSIVVPERRLIITQFDSCYSAHNEIGSGAQGDMAYVLGIWEDWQVYIGWKEKVWAIGFMPLYTEFVEYMWNELGDDETVYWAVQNAISHIASGYIPGFNIMFRSGNGPDINSIRFRRNP